MVNELQASCSASTVEKLPEQDNEAKPSCLRGQHRDRRALQRDGTSFGRVALPIFESGAKQCYEPAYLTTLVYSVATRKQPALPSIATAFAKIREKMLYRCKLLVTIDQGG